MQVVVDVFILVFTYIGVIVLLCLSFMAGKRISDSYNDKIINELQYQLRLAAAKEGVGYVAPPPRRKAHIDQTFMDKLKENGRATQKIET